MKRYVLIVTVALLLACAGASAQKEQKEQESPCAEAGTQYEMNQCAHKEFTTADAELNKVYAELVAKLDVKRRARLKESEQAWIKYRDANCEYESSQYEGGTMRPMVHSFCLARMTAARTGELKDQIELLELLEQ